MTPRGATRLFAAASAAVPILALLPAAPSSFTRLHPLRLAAAASAVLLSTLVAAALASRAAARAGQGTGEPDAPDGSGAGGGRGGPPDPAGPLVLLALAWLAWSAASLAWSPSPGLGVLGLTQLTLGLLWCCCLAALLRRTSWPVLVEGTSVGSSSARARRRLTSLKGAGCAQPLTQPPTQPPTQPQTVPQTGASPLSVGHQAMLASLLVAGALLACLALAQRAGHLRLGLHEVGATIGNPNHLAIALVALLPAALWLYRSAAEGSLPFGPKRTFAPLVRLIALLWAALVLLGLRATRCQAALLALGVMVIFVLATWPTWGLRRRLGAAALGAGLGVALVLAAMPSAPLVASLEGRAFITSLGLGVVTEAPLGGAGLGGFPTRVAWIQGAQLARGPGDFAPLVDAHHQALMIAGETGLVGLGLALILCVLVLRRIWASRREPVAQAGLAAWAGLFVFSLSETVFRDVGVLLVALTWLMLGWVRSLGEAPRTARRRMWIALGGAWTRASGAAVSLGRAAALPVALVVAFLAVGDARSDFLHARGLAALGRAGEGADRATFEVALGHYDRALTTALDSSALHLDRALVLGALGRPRGAALAARAAFDARPGPDRALLLGDLAAASGDLAATSGDLAAASGDLVEAVLWYQRAVDLHPRYARARNNLGVVLFRAGQPEAGCASLRRALSLLPFEPSIRGNWKALCAPPRRPAGPPAASEPGGPGTPRIDHQLGKRLGTSSRVTQGAGMSSRA